LLRTYEKWQISQHIPRAPRRYTFLTTLGAFSAARFSSNSVYHFSALHLLGSLKSRDLCYKKAIRMILQAPKGSRSKRASERAAAHIHSLHVESCALRKCARVFFFLLSLYIRSIGKKHELGKITHSYLSLSSWTQIFHHSFLTIPARQSISKCHV